MRLTLLTGLAGAALLAGGAAQAAAPTVEIKDAVARVTVIPEARDDVKVEIVATNASLPLTVRTMGDRTIVDGDLDSLAGGDRINGCNVDNGEASVIVRGVGRVAWADMPQIVVHTPMDVRVRAGQAVFGSIGRASSVDLDHAGCGDWTVANVSGALKVDQAGSGDTRTGSAASATIRVAGSGDVAVAEIAGPLSANIAGSGDVLASSVGGDVEARIAGSGDVIIRSGKAGQVTASIAGSGDVRFGGVAGTLNAKIAGSGDVRVAQVTGAVTRAVAGSGDVSVGPIRAGE